MMPWIPILASKSRMAWYEGLVLADAPLPGEEARYAQMLALVEAAKQDPALKNAVIDEATKTEKEMVAPLLQFRSWGLQLPFNWSTTSNNAAFGTDTFTRTAVAKSNILVNAPVGNEIFLSGPRCVRGAAQQRQSLHRDLRQGSNPASGRLLVAHPVLC